jgi:hypothetical protein
MGAFAARCNRIRRLKVRAYSPLGLQFVNPSSREGGPVLDLCFGAEVFLAARKVLNSIFAETPNRQFQ